MHPCTGARFAALAALAIFLATPPRATAATHAAPEVPMAVRICDTAGALPAHVSAAEGIVSDVYEKAGIALTWVRDCNAAERYSVTLLTIATTPIPFSPDTVGYATPGSTEATAIYDRVVILARKYRVNCGALLGYVIAHEIGHLLLPANSHSRHGVMRPNLSLDLADEKELTFDADQAGRMRAYLAAPPVLSTR